MKTKDLRLAQTLRDLPAAERPRERLLSSGAGSLSDAELLGVLLRTGTRGLSAVELARQLLRSIGGLAGLVGVEASQLRRLGVGPAKTASLLAAVEVGCRVASREVPEREPLSRPEVVARYLRLRHAVRGQEVMGVIYLDQRRCRLGDEVIYRGTLNRAAVEPRAILKRGLLVDAAAIILFHTHPSGDPAPSVEDLAFTRRMADACDVVGVELVDHLILGSAGRWRSLRRGEAW